MTTDTTRKTEITKRLLEIDQDLDGPDCLKDPVARYLALSDRRNLRAELESLTHEDRHPSKDESEYLSQNDLDYLARQFRGHP